MNDANVIKNLRTKHGLSQEEFAIRLGVVRQTVSRWERGTAEPGLGDIKNMCALFGVTPDYFFSANSQSGAESRKSASASQQKSASYVPPTVAEAVTSATLTTPFVPAPCKTHSRSRVRIRAVTAVFCITAILFVVMILCSIIVGLTAFSVNYGFDVIVDFTAIDFVISVLVTVLLGALSVLMFLYRRRLKLAEAD